MGDAVGVGLVVGKEDGGIFVSAVAEGLVGALVGALVGTWVGEADGGAMVGAPVGNVKGATSVEGMF
eukprot:gene5445-biopygen4986